MRIGRATFLVFACAALLAGRTVWADCGSPDCNPETDQCCNDDCTYMQEGDVCIAPGFLCRTLKCDGSNPPLCNDGSLKNAPNGTVCHTTACTSGECVGGSCDGTDPRCFDGDPCTQDVCNQSAGVFQNCDFSQLEDEGTDCSSTDGDTCTIKSCDESGGCVAGDPPQTVTCTAPPVEDCDLATCVVVAGTPTCQTVQAPAGTSCDTDPTDCKNRRCRLSGACGNQAAKKGARCDPDPNDGGHCTLSDCKLGGECDATMAFDVDDGVQTAVFATGLEPPDDTVTVALCAPSQAALGCDVPQCNGSGGCKFPCDAATLNQPCPLPTCQTLCTDNSGTCVCQ